MLELANRIMSLRSQLAAAEEEYRRYFTGEERAQDAPSSGWKDTAVAKILRLLRNEPLNSFRPEDIAAAAAIPLPTTRTTLSKLVGMGMVEKRGIALYGHKGQITSPADEPSPNDVHMEEGEGEIQEPAFARL